MPNHIKGPWGLTLIGLLAGATGYAIALVTAGPAAEDLSAAAALAARADAQSAEVAQRVAQLEEQLRSEQARHAELRADVEWMATRVEAAADGVETLLEESASGGSSAPAAPSLTRGGDALGQRPPVDAPQKDADGDALVQAGFDPDEVAAYRARVGELEMERLYLVDRAAREGWLGTDRFREENLALREELTGTREEFGDDLYDWALFGSGRANRVQVASVIEGSPAQAAGIEVGDIILSYGRSRIFAAADLQKQTRAGRVGETTRVELFRGGQTLQASVPRGPLGVNLRPRRVQPPSVMGRRAAGL